MPSEPEKKRVWLRKEILIPLVTCVIGAIPAYYGIFKRGDGDRIPVPVTINQQSNRINDFRSFTVIEREYAKIKGGPLSDKGVRQQIVQAFELVKKGSYADSLPLLVEAADRTQLPALL